MFPIQPCYNAGDTIYFPFPTFNSDGASVTITGLATTDIEPLRASDEVARASDNGYTLMDTDGIDLKGRVGIHGFKINTNDNSHVDFWADGETYFVIVDAITVDSQTVRFVYLLPLGMSLRPTTAGRTLDIAATGEAGVDLGNVTGTLTQANVGWVDANSRVDVGQWLGTAPLGLNNQRVQVDVQAIDGLASAATVLGLWLAEGVQTVADSGTTTTLVDAVLTQADGYWNGALLVFRSGTNAGRTAIITDFDAATDTLTFAPAVPDAVTTEGYVLVPGLGHADITAISQDATAADNLESQYDGTGLLGDTYPLRQDQGASISGGLAIRANMVSVTVILGSQQNLANTNASDGAWWTGDDDGAGAEFIFLCTPADTTAEPGDLHFEGYYDEPAGNDNGATIFVYNFQSAAWESHITLSKATADETHDVSLTHANGAPGSGTLEGVAYVIGDVLIKFEQDTQETGNACLLTDRMYVGFISAPITASEIVAEWKTQSQADPTEFHVNVKELDGSGIQQATGYIKVSAGTGTGQLSLSSGVIAASGNWNTVTPDAAGVVATALGTLETHGDSAWATATNFSTHSAANVYTAFGTGGNLTTCATATGFAVPGDLMGLANDAITAAKYDESSAYPVKSVDTGSTKIARTGADSDTLETLSDQIDTIEGGTGSGARTVAVTVDDGTDALENAIVRFTEGGNTYVGTTDASGEVSFSLDDATYALAISKPGHSFTPTTLVVDGDETETYSMTDAPISAPPSASTTTGVMTVYDEEQNVEESVKISVQITAGPGTDGIGYDSAVWTETSNGSGVVEFAGIVLGATYKLWRGDSKADAQTFTAPTTGDSFNLVEVIGRG